MHGFLSRIPCLFGWHEFIPTKIKVCSGGPWIEYYECRRCEAVADPVSWDRALCEVMGTDNNGGRWVNTKDLIAWARQQKTSSEMDQTELDDADWQGGYDAVVGSLLRPMADEIERLQSDYDGVVEKLLHPMADEIERLKKEGRLKLRTRPFENLPKTKDAK